MKYKALKSFCGQVNMFAGEVREIEKSLAESLLDAGYIVEVASEKTEEPKKKKPKKDE